MLSAAVFVSPRAKRFEHILLLLLLRLLCGVIDNEKKILIKTFCCSGECALCSSLSMLKNFENLIIIGNVKVYLVGFFSIATQECTLCWRIKKT
jgi:hypothetical protein